MPFEELIKELNGKFIVSVTSIYRDPAHNGVYIFDGKDEKRVREMLAAERAYVKNKKKGHSLSRLFKKNGVAFEYVAIPIDHFILWDKPDETIEPEEVKIPMKEEKPKRKPRTEPVIMPTRMEDIPVDVMNEIARAHRVKRLYVGRKYEGA